jgi:hypothetical protein
MITEKNREIVELRQKEIALSEQMRREFFPHIPQEIFIAFENFLFFMGDHSRLIRH